MPEKTPDLLTAEPLAEIAGIRHGFFTRAGGVSDGLYASLNVGFGSKDDSEKVAENRSRAITALGGATALNTVYQEHGKQVARADEGWDPRSAPRADGMVTNRPGLALGILTADCAPVLFADTDQRVIGAAHAGWRGAVGGILAATIDAMLALGAKRETIRAAVGPTIGSASYEVGPEFPVPFLGEDTANDRFFKPSSRDGHHMFDLPGYVSARLEALGVATVMDLDRDTCAEEQHFFSYRRATLRGEADYARGLSAIMLEA
ncbi:MAG: peptidoglycan editing factor PgeF [Alphaproteobacteria bacterium]|nr:peptidoglycan editing factor PgeF [Alphaproteobacteria bacterium]